ncbi:MAG: hypothetical protein V7641_2808 [Blastocatellia bacterium]
MNLLPQIQASLPPPYSIAADSVLQSFLQVIAVDLETFQEDLDRMRQSHWIQTLYRLADAAKLGALFDIQPFAWEHLELYRERLLALVVARLKGALGPNEIREFVYDYLFKAQSALGATLLPGLKDSTLDEAYQPPADRPRFRPLVLEENPHRRRTSKVLADRNGNLPYLFRWSERNTGLDDTAVELHISGLQQYRTVIPVLVNLTTGSLLGFADRIPFGQTLTIMRANPAAPLSDRTLQATLDGNDVSERLFSVEGFKLGVPFSKQQQEPKPLLPGLQRGVNEWIFLSVGMFDIRGLDHFFFSIASQELREAAFDETTFDQSLFPSGPIAKLEMTWTETEPASFEVHVPRYLVVEPSSTTTETLHEDVGLALESSIDGLRAAGVKGLVRFIPFEEVQRQSVRVRLPWKVLDPEFGPAGKTRLVELGGRFGESSLDQSRFE